MSALTTLMAPIEWKAMTKSQKRWAIGFSVYQLVEGGWQFYRSYKIQEQKLRIEELTVLVEELESERDQDKYEIERLQAIEVLAYETRDKGFGRVPENPFVLKPEAEPVSDETIAQLRDPMAF